VSTDRDRLLKENEDEARRIKEGLIALREAMLRSENALNVLAIERTNLESEPGEEQIEISPELSASIQVPETVKTRQVWPKLAIVITAIVLVMLAIGGLGIFDNDGSAPVARRVVLPTPEVVDSSASRRNEAAIVASSPISTPTNSNSTPDKVNSTPNEVLMNILPGTTYTSEISYTMKSSTVTLMEVQDTPQISLHLNHAPQSFFIPLKTPFRVDSEGISTGQFNGKLTVLANSKKHDLEIRFEPRKFPLEPQLLGNTSSE
jgi:hypothetical protein